MNKEDKWVVFEDRTVSLLERWRKFCERTPGKEDYAIETFLQEINDGFTRQLINR